MFHDKVRDLVKEAYTNQHAAETSKMWTDHYGEFNAYVRILSMATGEKIVDIHTALNAERQAALATTTTKGK